MSGMILPKPNVTKPYSGLRWARRRLIEWRRDHAPSSERKLRNAELNEREFWHGRTHLRSFPRIVQVGTNWTCNLKCNFCRLTMPWTQEELKKKPGRELSISDRVEEVIRELLPHADMLTLTPLGEPLMWSGLDPLLDLHGRIGSNNLALTSNGMLLNDKNAEKLVRGRLTNLFLSIDSNHPQVYAGMRVGGDLRVVEEGIRRVNAWKEKLNTEYPKLILNSTFMERNVHQLPSMVGWAQSLGFIEFSVQLMEIENPELEGEFLGHHVDLAHRKVNEALAEARRIGMNIKPHLALKNLISASVEGHDVEHHDYKAASPRMPEGRKTYKSTDPVAPGPDLPGQKTTDVHGFNGTDITFDGESLNPDLDMRDRVLVEKCHYPWYFMLIDTDGDVRPCCWASTSWGNLNKLSFDEIWNGESAQTMRRRFLNNDIPESCRGKHCRVDL